MSILSKLRERRVRRSAEYEVTQILRSPTTPYIVARVLSGEHVLYGTGLRTEVYRQLAELVRPMVAERLEASA